MGISFLNDLADKEKNKTSVLDQLASIEQPVEDTSFSSYVGHLVKNTLLAADAGAFDNPVTNFLFGKQDNSRMSPENLAQLRVIKRNLELANANKGDAWEQVKEDLKPRNFFSKIANWGNALASTDPSELITGLPRAIVGMGAAPFEAYTGLNLGRESAEPLSPEERADKIKETAAIAISSIVGGATKLGAGKVFSKDIPASLETASDATLNTVISKATTGKLARKILTGGLEGLSAGTTFGAVSRANREDQLVNMLVAIPFAALGSAMELTHIDKIDKAGVKASEIFNLRQKQYTPEKSLFDISKDIESLATADNLAAAVINGKIDLGKSYVVAQNVPSSIWEKMQVGTAKKQNMGLISKVTPEGNYDLLFYHKDAFPNEIKARQVFEETGFIPDEVVSYQGKDHIFTGKTVDLKKYGYDANFEIKDPKNGQVFHVPASEVSRKPDFDLHNPEVVMQSDLTLKGQILAHAKTLGKDVYSLESSQQYPFYEENLKANDNIQTGKPIAFVGLRTERGQRLPNTGTFYALTLEHLTGYKGGQYIGYSAETVKEAKNAPTGVYKLGSMMSAQGKETIPGIIDANLRVHRLAFENPFVFNGKHHSLIKDVTKFFDYYVVGGMKYTEPAKKITQYDVQTAYNIMQEGYEKLKAGKITQDEFKKLGKDYDDLGQAYKAQTPESAKVTANWSKVFTEQEMAAIKEAGSIEKKPVGVPTDKYLKSKQATKDYNIGKISESEFLEATKDTPTYTPVAGKTHPESHYAIVDRIVARAMRRNGYDAFVYKASVHNTEVVDLKLEKGGLPPVLEKPKATVTGLKSNVITPDRFLDKMYDEFNAPYRRGDAGLMERNMSWNDAFNAFANSKGFLPEELPSLKRNFLERLHKETIDNLPEADRAVYNKAIQENPLFDPQESFEKLRHSTNANNMYFDTHDAGTIVLRDRASNKELLRTQSIKEAEDFISKSGQERGVDLDGNNPTPPIFPATPDNIPKPNEIPELHKAGKLEQFIAWLDTSTEWLAASRAWANATDVTYGTSLAARIHDPLQVAVRQAHANARPWLERLKSDVEKYVHGSSKEERAKVSNYLESMTPDQIIANGLGGRKLNDLEIQAAKQFSEVDLTNVFKFRRRVGEIQKQFKRGNPQRQALYAQARQEFSIGDKELEVYKTMTAMRKMPLENASIGNSVRLARALQDESKGVILDRNLYAAKYMTASQLAAARGMENLSADLAKRFGIPNDKMLPNYFTHARLYNNGEISQVLKLFRSNKAADDLYADLIRTGEIDAYERDPVIAMRRYILAGFNHDFLNPAINSAQKALKEELLKIPDASRIKAERVVNQYISDLRGMPTAADNFTQNAFDTFMGKVGIKTNTNIRREWINAILSTVTGATQGFRVVQGLRDFYTNLRNTYGRLGVQRTARVLELGSNRERQAAYLRDGIIQGYGVLQFATPLEQELGIVGRTGKAIDEGINRFNQAGMKLSGQPSVFELFQTGIYAESREKVAKLSRDVVDGKYGKLDSPDTFRKAYKDIELDAFNRSTQIQFDKLLQSGKYEEAADFLGRQSIAEVIGMYGNANHPTGWNRNIGRIAGQFGMWPTNYRHHIFNLASQGDIASRMKRLARVGVMDLALTAVAAKTGISFYSWTVLPSMAWLGGPSIDALQTVYDATVGYGTDQNLAQSRLKQILPYNSDTDTWNLKHLYIPGSFFADDLAKAYDLIQNQGTTGLGLAKGLGLKVEGDNYQAGAIEEYLGEQMGTR